MTKCKIFMSQRARFCKSAHFQHFLEGFYCNSSMTFSTSGKDVLAFPKSLTLDAVFLLKIAPSFNLTLAIGYRENTLEKPTVQDMSYVDQAHSHLNAIPVLRIT